MVELINQTEGYPDDLKPGMVVSSVSTASLAMDSPKVLDEIVGMVGAVDGWRKQLGGKRGLKRLVEVAAKLFGRSDCVEHVRLQAIGGNSFSISRIRIPRSV